MGVVYLARDFKLGRRVALKLIDPALARSPKAVGLFLREARATARFNHPNIVTIHAVGQHGATPYIALEYLEGQSLLERMQEHPLGFKEAIRILLGVAEALREAHAHKIVHGDLKPANVFIPADGRPRVVDFGICRVIDPAAAAGAKAEAVYTDEATEATGLWLEPLRKPAAVGTPAYMAPEQWTSREVTGAADIWALGLIIGELLANWHPYEKLLYPSQASTASLRQAVRSPDPVPVPDSLGENVPRDLVELIRACLRKAPEDRPPASVVVQELSRALADHAPSLGTETAAPFPGLQPFSEAQARFFFGRESELAAFIERLRGQAVLPVVGPSGAGKSSFIYAGVIPRLKEQGRWLVIDLRPGSDPFAALADRLVAASAARSGGHGNLEAIASVPDAGAAPNGNAPDQRRLWRELVAAPALLSLKLHRLAQRWGCPVLLFVDQLEEVVTLVESPELRSSFVEAICAAATDRDDPIRVVFTLRDDFLGQLAETPTAREALSRVTVLSRPGAVELEQIVTRPLQVVGYEYDDAFLPQQMVSAVLGEPACLPLLQFCTRMLWERRDPSARCLRRSAYDQIGGVAGALAAHADGFLQELTPRQRATTRNLLLRLVAPTGTRQVLRRDRLLEGLGADAAEVLTRLTQARLVSVKQSDDQGTAEVEIVHESLIHRWSQLSRWITEGKEELRLADDVTRAANLWLSRGRRPEEVWRGAALHDAVRILDHLSSPVPPQVHEFVEAGKRLERRQRRLKRILAASGAALLVVAAAAACFALWAVSERENLARWQRDRAEMGWAEAQREGARAALLHGGLLEARAKLREALQAHDSTEARVLWRQLRQHPLLWQRSVGSIIYDVAVSPDGRWVAAAAQDTSVYVLDAATTRPQVFRGHRDQVYAVAYSPDGRRLASGSVSGEVLLWDERGQISARLLGHRGSVRSLAFSPDGRRLASASIDGSVRVWDLDGKKVVLVYRKHRGLVDAVAFAPDGATLASAGSDRAVHLWSLAAPGRPQRLMAGHSQTVNSLDFSADGKWLVSGGDDRTVRLWEVESGRAARVLGGQGLPVMRVRFAARGQAIAASSLSGGVIFWDARSSRQLLTVGAETSVLRFGFGPGSTVMATAGLDGVVRLWNTDGSVRVPSRWRTVSSQRPLNAVALSPDGSLLASSGGEGAIRLWDVKSGEVVRVLTGHRDQVYGLAFSPDGKLLASASWDASVGLWNVPTGTARRMLAGHQIGALSVAFNRDGTQLLSGGRDGTARLWDVASGQQERVLRGHLEPVVGVAFGRATLVATSSYDGKVRLWDIGRKKSRLLAALEHGKRTQGIAFSPDGSELATTCWDGSVRVWKVKDHSHRVLGRHEGRAYQVAWSGDGKVVSVGADGLARVWRAEGEQLASFSGHHGEVNDIAVARDGKLASSVGDDGTVRLWHVDTGAPLWKGTALVGAPPRLFSHQGWRSLDSGEVARPGEAQSSWLAAVERALHASATGSTLCLVSAPGELEIWDAASDRRQGHDRVAGLTESSRVVPLPGGCLTLSGGRVVLHRPDRPQRELAQQASALTWDGVAILIAAGRRILFFDSEGTQRRSVDAPEGVVALAHDGTNLVMGFAEGNVVIRRAGGGELISLQDIAPSRVTALHLGPAPETLVVGYANGLLGIWNVQNGIRLEHAQLHGAVSHLVQHQMRIYAATELGDNTVLDLSVLSEPYCELMREVWRLVPVVWMHGLPVVRRAPEDHLCQPQRLAR